MPTKRLTATAVGNLKGEPGKQVNYFDTKLTGFGVRVSASTATYFVQCRCKSRKSPTGNRLEVRETLGKVRRDEHGNVDSAQYDEVCKRAKKILDDAENDVIPEDRRREAEAHRQEEARTRKIEEAKDVTLAALFDRYLAMKEAKGKLKASTVGQYRQSMETHFADWMERPAREITGSMVEARHIEIGRGKIQQKYTTPKGNERKGQRGGKGAADAAMRVLRAVLSYGGAVYDDVFLKNPVSILSKTDGWYKLDRRESYISTEQLKPWFEGLKKLDTVRTRTVLTLGIFTGARKNEILRLKWSDVDLDQGVATFRETKNGKILVVPVAQYALDVLKAHKENFYSGPEGFIFPSYGVTGHLRDPRKSLEKVTQESGVNFMLHDFRRTFLTFCNALKVPAWTQKRLVNHAKPADVTEGYVQHEMDFLRQDVEAVAAYILEHAGLNGTAPETDNGGEAGKVVNLEDRRQKRNAA
ncbi:integrase [Geomonas limicola]|uniref:Integrase n=1 Tax=Geomonas limicola TaxID=2740186 RepID=A0A6V8NAY3_9BACT|nr:tyrosine-type recombinase/integrase [Geomonas limicola]GFO68693.1 integrase [Geomonas limicola]